MKIPKLHWPAREPAAPDPPGVTVPASLVASAKLAAWIATASLIYFLWLYTLDIAKDRSAPLHMTHVGMWAGELRFWFPYIIGFAAVAVGIPYVAKIAIPTFMSLDWSLNFWPKVWSLFIAVSVSLVVLAGTFAVQGDTILESGRESAVAVARVEQDNAVLARRIEDARRELDDMVKNESVYIRTAASMSPAAYETFIESRRGDWQYDRFVAYRSAAEDAERLRGEIAELRDRQARSTVTAAVQERVETEGTSWIGSTLDWLQGVRAILLSLVMDIVALLMPWIALRLEQARNRQLAMAGPREAPDEAHMIADLREEAPIAPEPMEAPREVVRDAETGLEIEKITPKPYWRKRKGQKQQVAIEPAPEADETGVLDPERTGKSAEEIAAGIGDMGQPIPEREPAPEDEAILRYLEEEAADATPLPDGEGVAVGEPYGPPAPEIEEDAAPGRKLLAAE